MRQDGKVVLQMGISTSALTSSLRFCDSKYQQLLALPQIELSWALAGPSIYPTNGTSSNRFPGKRKSKRRPNTQNTDTLHLRKRSSLVFQSASFRLSHPCPQSCITFYHTCTRSTSLPATDKARTFHTNPLNNPIPALHHVVQQLLQRQHGQQNPPTPTQQRTKMSLHSQRRSKISLASPPPANSA